MGSLLPRMKARLKRGIHGARASRYASKAPNQSLPVVAKAADAVLYPLHAAAREGNIKQMKRLLLHDRSTLLNRRNGVGLRQSALHVAVAAGKVEAVECLVSQGSNIELKNAEGHTPLHSAAALGQVEVLATLVALGSDLEAGDAPRKNRPLHVAIRNGQIAAAKALIAAGAKKNSRNKAGWSALHMAVEVGNKASLDFLLGEQGLGINDKTKDDRKETALHIAVAVGNAATVQLLVDRGARLEATDARGRTPLHLAATAPVVALLIRLGAVLEAEDEEQKTPLAVAREREERQRRHRGDPAWEDPCVATILGAYEEAVVKRQQATLQLYAAVVQGDIRQIQRLLGRTYTEFRPNLLYADPRSELRTALHLAAGGGQAEALGLLIDGGAALEAQDIEGETPLHLAAAAQRKARRCVTTLLASGASVNARNADGMTPLHRAAAEGQFEVVEVLGSADDADTEAKADRDQTALHLAARKGEAGAIRALVAVGASPEAVDRHGETPLHLARGGDAVAALIASGAALHATNRQGNTPLHKQASNGDMEALRALLDAGAELERANKRGETALHSAAVVGKKEIVEVLLSEGASTEAVNRDDDTPLHRAAARKKLRTVVVLMGQGASLTARNKAGNTPLHAAVWLDKSESRRQRVRAERMAQEQQAKEAAEAPASAPASAPCGGGASGGGRGGAALMRFKKAARKVAKASRFAAEAGYSASRRRRAAVVTAMVEQVSELEPRNKHALTPLLLAASCGNEPAVEVLLAHNARRRFNALDLQATDDRGCTALQLAAHGNHAGCELLLRNGIEELAAHVKMANAQAAAAAIQAVAMAESALEDARQVCRAVERLCEMLPTTATLVLEAMPYHGHNRDGVGAFLASMQTVLGDHAAGATTGGTPQAQEAYENEDHMRMASAFADTGLRQLRQMLARGDCGLEATRDGLTALMTAARDQRHAALAALLHAGANVDAKAACGPFEGCTALQVVRRGHAEGHYKQFPEQTVALLREAGMLRRAASIERDGEIKLVKRALRDIAQAAPADAAPTAPQPGQGSRDARDGIAAQGVDPSLLRALREVPFFQHFSEAQFGEVARKVVRRSFEAGQLLIEEGTVGTTFMMLEEGEVKVAVRGDMVAKLGPGAHFGEQALLTAQPRNADVIALTPCQVLEMGQQDFQTILHLVEKFVDSDLSRRSADKAIFSALLVSKGVSGAADLLRRMPAALPTAVRERRKQQHLFMTYNLDGSGTLDFEQYKLMVDDLDSVALHGRELEVDFARYVGDSSNGMVFAQFAEWCAATLGNVGSMGVEEPDRMALALSSARKGIEALVDALLDRSCSLDARDEEGWSALHHAAAAGELVVVRTLLQAGAAVGDETKFAGETPLHVAAANGRTQTLWALVRAGADVNVPTSRQFGRRPLHFAAKSGHTETLVALLDAGAAIEARDKHGCTALHRAVFSAQVGATGTLLRAGANARAKSDAGKVPLEMVPGGRTSAGGSEGESARRECMALLKAKGA